MLPPVGLSDLDRLVDDLELRRKTLGSRDGAMRAQLRGSQHQRMADIVAVADVRETQTLCRAETLFEGEEVCDRLAWVLEIRERIDDRDLANYAAISVIVSCE